MTDFPDYKTVATDSLIPYARNSRTHSDEQIAQIAASIKEFGFLNPVIIDGDNGIIAGHGRVMAAQKLGIKELPCIEASHLTDVQRRAYIIADNKLALNSEWDESILMDEINALLEFDFDVEAIGIDDSFISSLGAFQSYTPMLAYTPMLEPDRKHKPITENDIQTVENKLGEAYQEAGHKRMISVMCPHCAEEFMLDPESIK